MTIPYWQKEPITIPDEVGLLISLLQDPLRNHKLLHVVSKDNILRKKPETFVELTSILVKKVGFENMIKNEPLPPDGTPGYAWESQMEFHLIGHRDGYINYPPPPPGQPDSGETRWDGAENYLQVMAWLVHTILSENRQLQSEAYPSFNIDDIQPVGYEYNDYGYDGTKDVWAIILRYKVSFEMVVRE
jgi:hypothetical protein